MKIARERKLAPSSVATSSAQSSQQKEAILIKTFHTGKPRPFCTKCPAESAQSAQRNKPMIVKTFHTGKNCSALESNQQQGKQACATGEQSQSKGMPRVFCPQPIFLTGMHIANSGVGPQHQVPQNKEPLTPWACEEQLNPGTRKSQEKTIDVEHHHHEMMWTKEPRTAVWG